MDKNSNIALGIITDTEIKQRAFAFECPDDDDCSTDECSDCIPCIG